MMAIKSKSRKRVPLRVVAGACLAICLAAPAAWGDGTLPLGDGTLPLRLPSDGTLPLMLHGPAVPIPNRPGLNAAEATLRIQTTNAQPILVGQAPNVAGCSLSGRNISAHNAQGTVTLAGIELQIRRICFNHVESKFEVLAVRGIGRNEIKLSFVGQLPNPEPRSVAGRMHLTGGQSGRYHVQLGR